jgi:hypothetical protein
LSKIEQHQDCTRETYNQYPNYFGSRLTHVKHS